MSSEAPIVDCGPFCAVGFLRTIDKSEFSHSLDPKQTLTKNTQVRQKPTLRVGAKVRSVGQRVPAPLQSLLDIRRSKA
jgi:hypothetical protein